MTVAIYYMLHSDGLTLSTSSLYCKIPCAMVCAASSAAGGAGILTRTAGKSFDFVISYSDSGTGVAERATGQPTRIGCGR